MRAQASYVTLTLLGLATMVAAAFVGLGDRWGSLVMAVVGAALTLVGVCAALDVVRGERGELG